MASRTDSSAPVTVGVRRRLKLLLFVVVLFMSWALYTYIAQHGQMNERSQQLEETNRQLTEATSKSNALNQEIVRLNDNEYIGQIARKDLGMGLPGEKAIIVEPSGR